MGRFHIFTGNFALLDIAQGEDREALTAQEVTALKSIRFRDVAPVTPETLHAILNVKAIVMVTPRRSLLSSFSVSHENPEAL